jgi:pyridinium-3,5-bisthiocarboxylic acid mononucleotide nickel chelatase
LRVAYFDCQFGAAGDMLCASLLANGLDVDQWVHELKKIAVPAGSFEIEVEDVMRCLIASKKLTVKCFDSSPRNAENFIEQKHSHCHSHEHHEHGREHEHEHGQEHSHQHDHEHSHHHDHKHEHEHEHHHVEHSHLREAGHPDAQNHSADHQHDDHGHAHGRSVKEIVQIIENSTISINAKMLSLAIFQNLAVAESRVHNVSPDDVHFHEVGALDAIIDVVGFAIGYDMLGIEQAVVSPLTLGGGTVKTDHGIYPVPAPAVAYLVQSVNAPTTALNINYECLTPTGAAILTSIANSWGTIPAFLKIDSVGYGAGSLNPKSHPNAVRMFVGQCGEIPQAGTKLFTASVGNQDSALVFDDSGTQFRAEIITVIEATIDDCPPNIIAYALEKALTEGALDIAIVPATMKKGRSGHLITVLTRPEDRRKIETLLLRETSTLGVRTYFVERLIAEREFAEVKLSDWSIRIKIGRDLNGKVVNVQPEYSDCATYAERHDVPLRDVFEQALAKYATPKTEMAD